MSGLEDYIFDDNMFNLVLEYIMKKHREEYEPLGFTVELKKTHVMAVCPYCGKHHGSSPYNKIYNITCDGCLGEFFVNRIGNTFYIVIHKD